MSEQKPRADRPHMPGYGISAASEGVLDWEWAEERIRESHNYWLATTRPDGRPHVFPIWGIWRGGAFYFSAGKKSRKAANLRDNPHCVICNERADEAVIVEGVVAELDEGEERREAIAAYDAKYAWDLGALGEPIYAVRPVKVFGMPESDFLSGATRWSFGEGA